MKSLISKVQVSHPLSCFIVFACLCSCTPKISPLNASNRFLKNFNTHILNDSLQLHLLTPADINYSASRKSIQNALKKNKIKTVNPVLLFGTTNDPSYQFVVTIGDKKEKFRPNQFLLDTMLNRHRLHFLGFSNSIGAMSAMEADLRKIHSDIKFGPAYMQDTGSVMSVVNRSMSSNAFLKILTEIRQYPIPKNQGNSLELQMQLTFASFLKNNSIYDELINGVEKAFKPKEGIVNVINTNGTVNEKAMDGLIAKARLTNVVMINENHFYPAHRSFIIDLLPKLRTEGYTHLALEALGASADSLLNQPNGFPNLKTGFYSREQTFGNLLREAKALGYQFVAYENEDRAKDRELGQAENLYRKTIGADKNAKVLVIAGVDHILEQPTASGKKWMAMRFKELYQIDPLTISQTHLNLYRKESAAQYQLIPKSELNGIDGVAAVDGFILNNKQNDLSLWTHKMNYTNPFDRMVQVSVFYEKEMRKENDFHQNIPYYTAMVPAHKSVFIPYSIGQPVLIVIYDELGNILEKKR